VEKPTNRCATSEQSRCRRRRSFEWQKEKDSKGILYGTTWGEVFKIDTTGAETVLHNFAGYPTDGAYPTNGLVRDWEGIYGTAEYGGAYGDGVAFKLDTTGKETLYSFPGGKHGQNPHGGLIRDAEGNFYGTTVFGGTVGGGSCSASPDGCGTVFKLDKPDKLHEYFRETDLYSFTGTNGDGANPYATLIEDAEGNLYGTTYLGGAYASGTVFKLDKTGQETVLYSFCPGGGSCTDGSQPTTGLVRDAVGNLYGTTTFGGANGAGVVFKIAP
jgi:uncharacterized repeat protein (TIGR03803 family)